LVGGWLVGQWVGWLVGWVMGGWLVGRWVGWLVGWSGCGFVCCSSRWVFALCPFFSKRTAHPAMAVVTTTREQRPLRRHKPTLRWVGWVGGLVDGWVEWRFAGTVVGLVGWLVGRFDRLAGLFVDKDHPAMAVFTTREQRPLRRPMPTLRWVGWVGWLVASGLVGWLVGWTVG
jgi:hypothetical protein